MTNQHKIKNEVGQDKATQGRTLVGGTKQTMAGKDKLVQDKTGRV